MALQKKTTVRDIYANRTTRKKQEDENITPEAKRPSWLTKSVTKNAGTSAGGSSPTRDIKPNPALAQAVVSLYNPGPARAQSVVQGVGRPYNPGLLNLGAAAASRPESSAPRTVSSDSSGDTPAAKPLRPVRTREGVSVPESKSPSISIQSGAASRPSLSAAMKRGQSGEAGETIFFSQPTTLERIALSAHSGAKGWASDYMDYAAVGTYARSGAGTDRKPQADESSFWGKMANLGRNTEDENLTASALANYQKAAANEQAVIDSYERGEGVYDKADYEVAKEQLAEYQRRIESYRNAAETSAATIAALPERAAEESNKWRSSAAMDEERATHGLGTVGQTLVRGVSSTTQNLLDLGLSGGANARPSIAARVYGQSTRDALDNGVSVEGAVAIGLARAAAELIPEDLFGGNPLTDTQAGDGLVTEAARDVLAKPWARRLRETLEELGKKKYINNFVTRLGAGAFGEGVEEVITQGLNDVISAIAYGDEADLSSPKEYAEAFWGGVVGGLYGNIINPTNLTKNAQQDVDDIARNSAQRAERAAAAQAEQASIDNGAQNAARGAAGAGGITTGAQAVQSDSGALNAPQGVQAQQAGQRPRQTTLDIYQNRGTRQQNIDNAGQSAYTDISDNTVSGGAEGDTGAGAGAGAGRGLAENRDGVSDVYDKRDSNYQGQGRPGGLSVDSGFVLSEQAKSTIQSRGVAFVETRDVSADSAAFSSALDEARAANAKNGWAVSPKSAQDISENGVRIYMDENGSAGFGVAPDGDIEAVFANKSKGAPPHAAESLIPQAIAAGGSKLDCYGSGLVTLYSQYGFVPVARVVFDPEYANEGWDAGKGTPDIYFMMATDTDADSVVANGGSYPVPTQAELDALPLMEYDEAYAYRDRMLAERESGSAEAEDGGLYGRSVGAATPRRGEQVASRNNLQYDANLSEEGRSAVADAGLTHERISDSLANARAEANIIRDGDGNWLNLRDCMDDLQATIESGGVLSPEQVKLAEKVMTELDHMARDSGDRSVFNEFNRVVVQASKTDSAQSLRAWRSFSDGYLGTVDQASRVLETLQENPQTNHNQKRTAKEADEILRRVSNEVGEAADRALEKAASEDTPRRRRRRQSDDEDVPRRQYSPKAKAERDEVLDYLTAQKKRRERAAARAGASDATVDSDQFGLDDFFEMPEIDRMEIPKLRELIKQSWQDKQAVYENLMDYFVDRYGMSEQEAGLAANNISTLFYGELAELSSSALHRAFDKKKRGQTDTAWIDKAVEYINMGALTDPEFRDIASEKLFGHSASDEVLNRVSQYAEDAQEMRDAGDIDGLREQVFAISTERGYKPDSSIRKILDQRTDVNEMYNLAQSLAVGLAVDQAKPTFGKRLATWQYLSHLYNTRTIIRNVVANSVFAPVDRLSNTLAIGPDFVAAMIRSASEGGTVAQNRTVARQPWGLNRGVSETRRSYVEDALVDNALDINRGAAQGKYTAQNQRFTNRTFNPKGNAWERFNNFREGVLGLGLNVTDAVQKGTTKGQSEAAMRSLMNRGGVMTEEAAQAITESDMLYRSFQRETPLGSFLSIAREGANVVGIGKTQGRNIKTHEFGLGSLVDTYTQVPGALVHTAADYTPLGIVNTALEIYNAIQFNRGQTDAMADPGPLSQQYKGLTNADASVVAQHNAALSIGRMMTGGAIFGLFSYLAAAGAAAVRLYGDDDRDEDETLAAQGVSGFQFNQDAFIRSLLGRDTTWRNGDVIHDLSQYPPVSTIAEIAVICRDEDDDNKFIRILDATARGLIEQFGDLSMVSAAKTVYDDIQYRGDKNAWEVAGDIAGDLIGNSVSGMVPGFVRQIAKATDPVMRDTSSDTVLGRAWNRFRSAVPGLRQTLPAKVDYKGEERRYAGNTLTRLLNTFVLPGDVTIYRQDEVVDYITQLSDSTGTSLYADAYAPKKVVYDGESYELNTDARRMYNETYKSAYYDAMEAFMKSDYAKTMPDDMAAEVASGLRALAAYQARREYFKLRGMSYTPENDTYARYDSIGDPALYMSMRAAMKQLSESEGRDNEAFKAVYAQWRTLPPKGRAMYTDGVEGQFDGISTLKKLDNCLQAGMSTQQFYEAKAEYRALSDNDSLGATARRAAFAHWLDTESGFTTSARAAALENFPFTTTIVADEGKYEQMASSGVGNAASERIFNSIQQLQPESGNKTVSDLQRYEAITASGASESEQLAALRVYASDSQIEYFQAAFDNGIALGKWTAVLRSVRESETGNMSQGNLVRAMYENGIPNDKARAMYNVYKAKHHWRSSYEQAYANAW